MAILFAPQTVMVYAPSQHVQGSKRADAVEWTGGTSISAMVSPKDVRAAYEDFGVEGVRPHLLMCDWSVAGLFRVGGRVTLGDRTFTVNSPVKLSIHGLPTDHASVMLEELV